MPRKTPPGRVQDIARAACEVFIEKGYRRTLMTDVAARLEIPAPGHVLELVRSWFAVHATFPALSAATEPGPGDNAAAELAGIIDELYSFIEQNRLLLLLIESLVIDHPELSELYVSKSKQSHIARLSAFLRSRASSGGLRPLSDPDIGAHFLAESVAWFAQHRKADPGLALIDDERARAQVRELLLSAFTR
jgi:hypothetical protein